MGYASKLAKSYSNPDTVWNSLGAVGSTGAWNASSADLAAFRDILSSAKLGIKSAVDDPSTYRPSPPAKYGMFGTNAFDSTRTLSQIDPTAIGKAIAGKYMSKINRYLF